MYLPAALHVLPERMFRAISLWQVPADMRMHTALFVSQPFPSVCGRICNHPCQAACNRNDLDESVGIRDIKRFVADKAFENGMPVVEKKRKSNGKKIAVIGAGPSGLSCAYYLQLSGYSVEVFESESVAGGVLAYGIPEYRLPKAVLNRDIQAIRSHRCADPSEHHRGRRCEL